MAGDSRSGYDLSRGGGFGQLAKSYRSQVIKQAARIVRAEADKYSNEQGVGGALHRCASRLEERASQDGKQ